MDFLGRRTSTLDLYKSVIGNSLHVSEVYRKLSAGKEFYQPASNKTWDRYSPGAGMSAIGPGDRKAFFAGGSGMRSGGLNKLPGDVLESIMDEAEDFDQDDTILEGENFTAKDILNFMGREPGDLKGEAAGLEGKVQAEEEALSESGDASSSEAGDPKLHEPKLEKSVYLDLQEPAAPPLLKGAVKIDEDEQKLRNISDPDERKALQKDINERKVDLATSLGKQAKTPRGVKAAAAYAYGTLPTDLKDDFNKHIDRKVSEIKGLLGDDSKDTRAASVARARNLLAIPDDQKLPKTTHEIRTVVLSHPDPGLFFNDNRDRGITEDEQGILINISREKEEAVARDTGDLPIAMKATGKKYLIFYPDEGQPKVVSDGITKLKSKNSSAYRKFKEKGSDTDAGKKIRGSYSGALGAYGFVDSSRFKSGVYEKDLDKEINLL